MPCCGQKRAAVRSRPELRAVVPAPSSPLPSPVAQTRPPAEAVQRAAPPARGERKLRYTERSSVRVRGSATGRFYEFSGEHPVQPVDARDAPALLATRFFRTAY